MKVLSAEIPVGAHAFILDSTAVSPKVDRSEMYNSLGYGKKRPDSGMNELIEEVLSGMPNLAENSAGYAIVPAHTDPVRKNGVVLDGRFFETGTIIASQLSGMSQAAVFVCTIGSAPEMKAEQLAREGDPALSYINDVAASVYVESLTDILHNHIEMKMQNAGLGVTNRFSPGYCGWQVQEQHKLFALLPEGFCGIHLTGSAFMQPRKSVSGIIGIGAKLSRRPYACAMCSRENCIYRLKRLEQE